MTTTAVVPKTPAGKMKLAISTQTMQDMFSNALGNESGAFLASVIDLYSTDTKLQKCDPQKVLMECAKAASLKLGINKSLGFAYVTPYKDVPQFQIGYKGIIQLALRTGQFQHQICTSCLGRSWGL